MDHVLTIFLGSLVGLSLGLTGGGGSILAVPMLVYGLHLPGQQAALVSLFSVGGAALIGTAWKIPSRKVQWLAGLVLATGGLLGAPLGIWAAQYLPERVMLLLFSALMVWVAVAMWKRVRSSAPAAAQYRAALFEDEPKGYSGASCRFSPSGRMLFTSRCAMVMSGVGLATGVMSGIFGVGGGFIIVPALTMMVKMDIRGAVATSLLVVGVVSFGGVVAGFVAGRDLPLELTLVFLLGGVIGLLAGISAGARLNASTVQQVFAVVIGLVAAYVAWKAW